MRLIDADKLIRSINSISVLTGLGLQPVITIADVKELINAIPTASDWISVKEKLPATNVEVLAMYVYDDKPGERYVEPTFYFDDGNGKGHWHLGDEHTFGPVRKTIIAWMPMPKPYEVS